MTNLRRTAAVASLSLSLFATACGGGGSTPDTVPPSAPVLLSTAPASPARDAAPDVTGTAEAGSTVLVYVDAACTGAPAVTVTASAAGAFTAANVAVAANATTTLRAAARDAAGNVSPCSNALAYRHDDLAPAAPVLAASSPASPSRSSTTPDLSGTAEPGATVLVYAGAACTGTPAATTTADAGGAFTAPGVAAAANATTTFRAAARDAAGNVSPCSDPLAFRHDGLPPTAPALLATTPASPSSASTTPDLSGTAEAGTTVLVYVGAACAGAPVATVTAGPGGDFTAAAVAAAANATTAFSATATDDAGNVSACSTPFPFVHDSLPPAAPVLLATSPASPTNGTTTPDVGGTAEPGAAVLVYVGTPCTGTPAATVTADAGGSFTAAAVAVAANVTSFLRAAARDAAGNVSACSDPLGFTHDDQAPAAPTLSATSPATTGRDPAPLLRGTAEGGATLRVYAQAACGGAPVATFAAPAGGAFDAAVPVAANASTTLTASATDAAGNVSACSGAVTYLHDDVPPAAPVIVASVPASPSGATTQPDFRGTTEPGAIVQYFVNAACTGAPANAVTASAAGDFLGSADVAANASSAVYVVAHDRAGNTSPCSTPFTFVHDSLAPGAPVLSTTVPASPSPDAAPHLAGTAEAGATLRVFAQAACAGVAVASITVPAGGAFDLAVPVGANATTTLTATATDAAGNASACSGALDYRHDDQAPAAPALVATTPPSPAPAMTPTLAGTAEPLAQVTVYGQADCTGPALETTFAAADGAFVTPALAVALNATTSLAATATDLAGNRSPCSAPLDYRHDDVPPAAPALAGSTPPSGGNANAPVLDGTGEPGARVALYTTADCSGAEAGSGVAAPDGAFAVAVSVADNTTTTFRAAQVDQAGNASACSATSVTYVEESRTFSISPTEVTLDRSPSLLDAQDFTAALAGGPDTGVTWSVEEVGGGTITPLGRYTAPAVPGTYHVVATTAGPLPPLTARAVVTVRHPVVAGVVTYAGAAAGRLFVSVQGPFGNAAIGGTSLAVAGPGAYPFTVRGVPSTGIHRVQAWFDATGVERYVPAADPFGEVSVDLQGSSVTGLAIALAPPAPAAPPAAAINAVLPGPGMAVVLFDTPRDPQGLELAEAYLVECSTGAPPAAPGPGALRVPAGYDSAAFAYGLTDGVPTRCSLWTERGPSRSAPAVSAPFVPGPGTGPFQVSGTVAWTGPAPAGPLFVVLLDQASGQAFFQQHAAPAFPLAFQVTGVPPGAYALGVIVDRDADGRLGPTDLNTFSTGQAPFVTVDADRTGQDLAVAWADASAHAVVGHNVFEGGGESWDLVLLVRSGDRLPATSVALSGPDVLAPADMGVGDAMGGSGVGLTAVRSLGATPPSPGTYPFDVGLADGAALRLSADVTAASLLDPPVPTAPVLGADAPPVPTFTWLEPALPPLAGYGYRLSLSSTTGGWIWDTDAIAPAQACAAGVCQAVFGFDGRASLPSLPPGDYRWAVQLQSASLDVARAEATFHVPVEVTVTPTTASLAGGATQAFTATVTGTGSVTWEATCGTVTPRADPLVADYQAPGAGPCTVTARSTQEPSRVASATVTVLPVTVTVAPATATVAPLQVQYFSAAVDGLGSVGWSATCGSIVATADPLVARWVAPATVGPCLVTATHTIQATVVGTALVSVAGAPQYALDPPVATLNPGQAQPFALRLGGVPRAATFTVVEAGGGTVDAAGVYTAPGTTGTFHLVAADAADPTRFATSVIRVVSAAAEPQPQVTITPTQASTVTLGQVAFSAAVSGCVDQSVAWSVREVGGGTVSPAGGYTAPDAVGTFHVVATAACDGSKSAAAAVTVDLPSVSGTVTYGGARGGPVYLTLVSQWGDVVSGTRLDAPGPFTLRGVRRTGDFTLLAWRDSTGTSRPSPRFQPSGQVPVTLSPGGSVSGLSVALADPPPAVAPGPPAVSVAPGADLAVVMWNPSVDPATQEETADRYEVLCDTSPVPSSPRAFTTHLSDARAIILTAAPGTVWACVVQPWSGSIPGTPAATPQFDVGPIGGNPVSGTVTATGLVPTDPLYVLAMDEATGLLFTSRIAAPSYPQAWLLPGVEDGFYNLAAMIDVGDDGVLDRTEPSGFEGYRAWAELVGAPLAGLGVRLDVADGFAEVTTSRNTGNFGTSFGVQLAVRNGRKVPAAAVALSGPGVLAPTDLGMKVREGGDSVVLGTRLELGSTAPVVGDTYTFEVRYTDGTTAVLQDQVSAVLQPPTPLAPIDPLAVALVPPATPVFSWTAPSPLPADAYHYMLWVGGAATWSSYRIPPSQLSVAYNADGRASPAALPAGTYDWTVSVRDALGNEASRQVTFTVGP